MKHPQTLSPRLGILLIAVAIPSFLGFRASAQDRAAQATLNNAEKVATVVVIDQEGFPGTAALLVLLPTLEPRIEWLDHQDSSTGPRQVSIDHDDGGNELAMASMSDSGTCYYQRLHRTSATVKHHVDGAATCNAHTFQDGAGIGW